jgi:hypothetical protein
MRSVASLAMGLAVLAARAEAGEVLAGPAAFAGPSSQGEERSLRKVLENYVQAIEAKDVALFRFVKPNLSPEEERRARKAFESVQSQAIIMTIQAVEVLPAAAIVRVSRRDTINRSIVSSFPQTFTLDKAKDGWTIREIATR